MKIIFLNVWGSEMRDELVEFIKDEAKDTDIFCFQEATDKMKYRCASILSNYIEISDYKFVSEDDDFPQSIFVRNDIEVLSSGTLMGDAMDCGLAIYVAIKTERGRLYICNVHGTARPGDKLDTPGRLKQSTELIEFFKDIDSPVVIGGDFNMSPETVAIRMFGEHGYQNLIKDFKIDTTRNHFAWDLYPDSKQYFSDYVFLNDKIRQIAFSVPKNEVSDHLPLILDV